MMDLLLMPISGIVTGLQLLVSSIITFTWGGLAIYDAIGSRRNRGSRLWGSFEWSLGWFLITGDAVIYFALSAAILRDSGTVPVWFFLASCVAFFWVLAAFRDWARGKINGGWDGH